MSNPQPLVENFAMLILPLEWMKQCNSTFEPKSDYRNHHTTTTVLRPFFRDHPGAVSYTHLTLPTILRV